MLRLLLDAHLSPSIARRLRQEEIDAVPLCDWLTGNYLSAADDQLLEVALADQRVLVTYDCRTIPPLLKEWAEVGRHHGGVVLVDEKTLRSHDVGGLLRALRRLAEEHGSESWQDRVVFLRARGPSR